MKVAPLVSMRNLDAARPWMRRHRAGIRVVDNTAVEAGGFTPEVCPGGAVDQRQLRDLGIRPKAQAVEIGVEWPAEPPAPPRVDAERLATAMEPLCHPGVTSEVLRQQVRYILQYSRQFSIDPTLLGAVIAHQSRCHSQLSDTYGTGLGRINLRMHRHAFRNGVYRYWLKDGRIWKQHEMRLDAFHFDRAALLHPEANIYFTAAFLSIFKQQCRDLDAVFGAALHRHYVSHFVWGDRVRDANPEDMILRDRRRLLEYYYGAPLLPPRAHYNDVLIASPLDGVPRKITSGLGEPRENGRRRHTGIDFASSFGEPVRAVASGKVVLAGADLGNNRLENLSPDRTRLVRERELGPRGLLVTIQHRGALKSVYMHLAAYVVKAGQRVSRGQLIGYVGETGIKRSPQHLHFELWDGAKLLDPYAILKPYLFRTRAMVQRRVAAKQRYREMHRYQPADTGQRYVRPGTP